MNTTKYISFLFISIVCGILLFLYQKSWIILNIPTQLNNIAWQQTHNQSQSVAVYVWNKNQLHIEHVDILKNQERGIFVQELINQFLKLYYDSGLIKQATTIQSTILSNDQKILFISFNHNPFTKESSTFEKLMIIKGLLKTLTKSHLNIQSVQFLANHQPLPDSHLNFDIPWSINHFDS